ncbi:hypothetical protein [Microbacterium sp. p3-SID336]|uniref:hypothetical protein n=1 Tax=Microbacterium sp. p3-SID336 TaxID=2916212 RepID=UPI0021A5ABF3|nr:hypothetical protein [Microbacterium sp. p3-SID336]MCT1479367.1 hypothetical protein [Microbacterium sp. p3-SID336]
MAITIDFTRPPNKREREKFERRLERLERPGYVEEVERIGASIPGPIATTNLTLRQGFSYRDAGISTDASDRKAPPPEMRPPATRLMTSRGGALRFELTLIAVAQANRKATSKARLKDLPIEGVGSSTSLGWTDLIAADASDSRNRHAFITAREKRARSVRSALATLEEAGLVVIPDKGGSRGRYENFVLLNERGRDAVGEVEEYRVPRAGDATFAMPEGFIGSGWLHVLEDSEIALLLMVACRKGAHPAGDLIAMDSHTRLRHYGIHRDSFSAARKTLEWFGLLEVEEMKRHDDGRAEDTDLQVHRLGLKPGGFDAPAPQAVIDALRGQLARR